MTNVVRPTIRRDIARWSGLDNPNIIEVGQVFYFGDKYTKAMGVTVTVAEPDLLQPPTVTVTPSWIGDAVPAEFGVPIESALAKRERLANQYDYDYGQERIFLQLVPALRRVRAVSPANRSDGYLGSDISGDDGFFFDIDLVALRKVLGHQLFGLVAVVIGPGV